MFQSHTIPASKSNPLFIAQYPMYNGTFCPHLFWHETVAASGGKPHREEIWFAMYRQDVTGSIYDKWSKPKRLSHRNATICLLNYIPAKTPHTPPRVYFTSIYLPDQLKDPTSYSAHPEHRPALSITSEQLHTEPTGQDICQFFSNPNYFFTHLQLQLLSRTMMRYFPSDSLEYKSAHQLWSSNNPGHPIQQTTWPTHSDREALLKEQVAQPPQQVIWTSSARPHTVDNYPYAYGKFTSAKFWIDTREQTKTSQRKEVAYVQYLNENTQTYSLPKACSPAKATICLMHTQNRQSQSNYGLPYFSSISLLDPNLNGLSVLDFATNPDNYFTVKQQSLLLSFLTDKFTALSPEIDKLRSAWANRPTVPDPS